MIRRSYGHIDKFRGSEHCREMDSKMAGAPLKPLRSRHSLCSLITVQSSSHCQFTLYSVSVAIKQNSFSGHWTARSIWRNPVWSSNPCTTKTKYIDWPHSYCAFHCKSHTRINERRDRSWSRSLGSQHAAGIVMNPAVGCHYFPPGLQLPSQPENGTHDLSITGLTPCGFWWIARRTVAEHN